MKARSVASKILLVVVATLMLALSATLAWAVTTDYKSRGLVPQGVTMVGRNLSGMTESQARAAIQEAVSAPMLQPITVTGDRKTWTLDPHPYVAIDVDTMVSEAYSTRRTATLVERLNSDLRGVPLPNDVKPEYSVDSSGVALWVAQRAAEINRKPVSATRKLMPNYTFKIKREKYGARVDQASTVATIVAAMSADAALNNPNRSAVVLVKPLRPKVLHSDFKVAIIVSIDRCRIYLFNGAKLVKSYPCAPGQPAYPTPTGDFKIDSKSKFAPWINPGSAWAASMPAYIPGGPDNPMGDTKIGINYPGVFMHSIPPGEFGSIGTHASHACMRMYPWDVHDLYKRVKIGEPVFIRY